ncbi:thioredoxin reductase (NADPH) [Nitratiruptor sp. YY08-26]|uniref:thioredoxin-disulfide reductase n=1 Tax=unclassified Nitratiruptor TaxID=2624044 RepID=UPI0019165BA1|nr:MULTISPECIES: thioredoxin-disulfide reductase [unclassified Nitratiruptor]BCD62832.1 thioredoxin reductase (NADPH) [Nitratiruptor sp. YY08-13]BCD66768.1 thioredoxin reductase (NADPH) [Nitratiruptor sp. YY08-26]
MLDLAIVGGGPAGLTAGLYATRGGLKDVVMYEKGLPGGQITQSSEVENYPGVCEVVTGMELMECWPKQAMRFGLQHQMQEVKRIERNCDGTFTIKLVDGSEQKAKAVIVCTGSVPKRAGFEGEDQFFGKGVSTCATCDGFFYKDKEVAVLGGGDTALEEALYLANIVSKVYLIHRRDKFRAAPATVERVMKNPKIELLLNASVKRVYGDERGMEGIIIEQEGKERDLKVPGIFVFVGMNVNNDVLKQEDGSFLCSVNHWGEVIVDLRMRTDIPGLFAAGDIRADASKQVVCAAGDGATAALSAISYIENIGELRPC